MNSDKIFASPEDIKNSLHQSLNFLENLESCVLLDYPDYLNIGDHLIWLGTVYYLSKISKTKILYASSVKEFSPKLMQKLPEDVPILLQGGGNLGDLWPLYQSFREDIVKTYPNHPIVILPQTIYFQDVQNLEKASKVFNSHQDLTIFVRERYSYELAMRYFQNCKVVLAPDMAFNLVSLPELDKIKILPKKNVLYHCRRDFQPFPVEAFNLSNIEVSDWISYQWKYRGQHTESEPWHLKIPGGTKVFREGWQRGLSRPLERMSRERWNQSSFGRSLSDLCAQELHKKSWDLAHSGICQLKSYPFIITNRMHGHVLSLILKIPHLFLPGSYHKNKSFYDSWSSEIDFCKFVSDASHIEAALQELSEFYK